MPASKDRALLAELMRIGTDHLKFSHRNNYLRLEVLSCPASLSRTGQSYKPMANLALGIEALRWPSQEARRFLTLPSAIEATYSESLSFQDL